MKAITILAFFIVGLGALAWVFATLDENACLLPIEQPNTDHRSRVVPSREGILLITADRIYQQSQSGNFDKPVSGLDRGKYVDATVFDTKEGVFILTAIGSPGSNLYHFTASTGLEPVLAQEERQDFKQLEEISDGVFVILIDNVVKLEEGRLAYRSLENPDQCTMSGLKHVTKTESLIFFETTDSLCKLKGSRLDVIRLPNDDGLDLEGATETSRGVLLWGPSGAYRLDENNRVGKIEGISDDPTILGFYERSSGHGLRGVYVATTNGLFAYSQEGVLIGVPGDKPGVIHSMHEIRGALYTLASNGVFRLDKAGKLERLKGRATEGVIRSFETTEGVFFIYSDDQTYRLTDSGEVLLVALPQTHGGKAEKPSDIKNSTGWVHCLPRIALSTASTKRTAGFWFPVAISGEM